jgi:hypothetical protein
MTGRLTCRWCNYSVPAIYTGRDGKVRSGFPRLRSHQEGSHPEQDDALSAAAMEHEAEIEREIAAQAERDAR